jgi:hypothetical protein
MSFKELLFLRLSIYIPVSRFAMDDPCRDDSIHPVYSGLFYSEFQYLSYPGFFLNYLIPVCLKGHRLEGFIFLFFKIGLP